MGQGGKGGVEWSGAPIAHWHGCSFSVNEVANVIFSSRCVRPPASVHSPRTGLGGPGSDPAFALISPLILEKSYRSLWSPPLSAVKMRLLEQTSSKVSSSYEIP